MAKKEQLTPNDIIIKSLLKKFKELDYTKQEMFVLFKDEMPNKVARSRAKKKVYDLFEDLKGVKPKVKRDPFEKIVLL